MTLDYRPGPGEIPTTPGVYRFSDDRGRVLYVGKAKNLRARLSNYFAPLPSLHERTRRMVTTASSLDWTVVASELEALQLEYTWIKEFEPPFNVTFRDDKSYPYLAVTLADEAPRAVITRKRTIPGARYFGPYPKVWAVRETLELMLGAFPIRTCSDADYVKAMATGKPCFLGQIGRCGGPCTGRVSIAEHRALVEQFVAFLAGNDRRFIAAANRGMQRAAAAQDYEAAARYRDQVQAMQHVLDKSAVVLSDSVDTDVFGIADDELAAAIQQFIVRGGRIRGTRAWVVDKELDMSRAELIDSLLQTAYDGQSEPAKEIILPELPADSESLETWLSSLRGRGAVHLRTAHRGEKAALLLTATANANGALSQYKTRRTADFVARSSALGDIQTAIGMTEAPLRIECFDVSHLAGTNIVASMVVFEDGLPRKDQYRRFAVAASTDDTDSIYQVLSRRLAHLVDPEPELDSARAKTRRFAYPPQLLIVDGGQPQVAAAARALADSGVAGIQLVGIAKRLEELWLPDEDFPVILPRNSEALFLLQRLRDEAHRFALSFQRRKRKRDIRSQLSEIPGLGPRRVTALLAHFGSVSRLRSADAESIATVPGIGPGLAETIRGHLAAAEPPVA